MILVDMIYRIESPDNGGRRTKVRGSRYEVVPSLKNRYMVYIYQFGKKNQTNWRLEISDIMPDACLCMYMQPCNILSSPEPINGSVSLSD